MSHNNAYDQMCVVTDHAVSYWRLDQASDHLVNLARTTPNTNTSPGAGSNYNLLPASNNLHSTLFTASNSDYITVTRYNFANEDGVGLALSAFSIEAWIKPVSDQSATDVIAICGQQGTAGLYLAYGVPTFYVSADGSVKTTATASSAVVVGDVYHLVGTFHYDGDTPSALKLYVNGSLDGSNTMGTSQAYSGVQNFTIGSWDTSELYFDGYISNVAIYAQTLTSTQVSNHYGYSG